MFLFGFWNSSFGPQFWKAFDPYVVRNVLQSSATMKKDDDQETEGFLSFCGVHIKTTIIFAIMFRTAINLDSSFFKSVESESTWDSHDTIARLLWNMPLCLNWFEILLLQLYEFERCFLPFCCYPLPEQIKPLVEVLYIQYCKRTRFLVKSAIIVAEYIYMNENDTHGRCYDARITLKPVITECCEIMKFLKDPAYQILEVIVREACSNDSCEPEKYEDVQKVYCTCFMVHDMDEVFNKDRRSISFWLKNEKLSPMLDESLQFFPCALKALQKYVKQVKEPHNCERKYSSQINEYINEADRDIFMYAFTENLDTATLDWTHGISPLIINMLSLLEEDQLLKKEEVEELSLKLSANDSNTTDEYKALVGDLEHFARVYTVCSAVVGSTYKAEVVKLSYEILLTRLLNAECHSMMVFAACRFISTILRELHIEKEWEFPSEFIKAAKINITARDLKILNVSEAMGLLFDQGNQFKDEPHYLATHALDNGTIFSNNLEDFESFLNFAVELRMCLLYKLSKQLLCNTNYTSVHHQTFDNVMFPYQHVLEYGFAMEIAALKACLKKGEKFKLQASRLTRLLARRAKWLSKEFLAWTSKEVSPSRVETVSAPQDMFDAAVSTMFKTYALLIPLQSIFNAYLTKCATLHPVFQSVPDILIETQDFSMHSSKQNDIFNYNALIDFHDTVKLMGLDYIEKLLDHCIEMWSVPPLCADVPGQDVNHNQFIRFQVAYTALFHSVLLTHYSFMSRKENFVVTGGRIQIFRRSVNVDPLIDNLMKAESALRTAVVKKSMDLNDMCKVLDQCFNSITKMLSPLANRNVFSAKLNVCRWRGYEERHFPLYKSVIKAPKRYLKALEKYGYRNLLVKTSLNQKKMQDDKKDTERTVKLRICFCCGVTEPVYHLFKKCSLCIIYKWRVRRSYCSLECQAQDWKVRHCQQHRVGEVVLPT